MQWFNRKILLIFTSSSILWQVTYVGCEFAILRFVEPDLIGIWQLVLLIQSYSAVSRLGIINAMNREFPFFLGQKNDEKAKEVHSTTFSFVLMNGLILSIVFLGLALYYNYKGFNWTLAFGGMSFIIFAEFVANYLEATLRGVNKFGRISKYQITLVPIALITLLLPWEFDFSGLVSRAIIISGSKSLILFFLSKNYLSFPNFRLSVFKYLFNIGWRLWIWNYLKNVAKSFPRLAIVTFSGTTLLGLYAPVNWLSMAFASLSGSISSYIYPNLSYNLSKEDAKVGQQSLKVTKYALLLFLPFTIIGIVLIPYIIPFALPKYSPAILAMQVSLVSGLFESVNLSTTAFATLKAWKPMFYHVVVSIVLKAIFVFLGYFLLEDKLLGVVSGLCVSSIIMFGITWMMVSGLDKKLELDL